MLCVIYSHLVLFLLLSSNDHQTKAALAEEILPRVNINNFDGVIQDRDFCNNKTGVGELALHGSKHKSKSNPFMVLNESLVLGHKSVGPRGTCLVEEWNEGTYDMVHLKADTSASGISGITGFEESSSKDIVVAECQEDEFDAVMAVAELGFIQPIPRTYGRTSAPVYRKPKMRIGVLDKPKMNQFVRVRYDHPGKRLSVEGFSIDVFKAALEYLPYKFPYHFVPYRGTYDSLVKQILPKDFAAVVGDTSILADVCDYAEFSYPWTDIGVQMVVCQKPMKLEKAGLFMKPFTKTMWGMTLGINLYNGFVLWLIERTHKPELRGTSVWTQMGTLTLLAFTTLFSLQGGRLHSNLSRMTMIMWLFVALVIMQTYTANLSSMLTAPPQMPHESSVNIESLKKSNAKIGCNEGSFVSRYLVETLGFESENIRTIASIDDYPQALERGDIEAAFLEVPYVQILLAKYCNKDFAVQGPTYKVGGLGFVFPKGSQLLHNISQAILEMRESGRLLKLQNAMLSSYNCSRSDSDNEDHRILGVDSFWGLLLITGGTSTVALTLFIIRFLYNKHRCLDIMAHQDHDPDFDEIWMFAPEMTSQNRAP